MTAGSVHLRGALRRGVATAILAAAAAGAALAAPAKPASLSVRGLGWLENRKTQHTLDLLIAAQRGPTLDAGAIEDAAMIVFSILTEQGYLEPVIEVEARQAGGDVVRQELDAALDKALPRPLSATSATLNVKTGRRFKLVDVEFEGLSALPANDARALFQPEYALLAVGSERAYSAARLQRSADNLLEELHRLGYAEAEVVADDVRIDRATGDVRVTVAVRQGSLWRVAALNFVLADGVAPPAELGNMPPGKPWSAPWRQDVELAVRRWYFQRGYPDVTVSLAGQASPAVDGVSAVSVTVRVDPGPFVTLGGVRFMGNERTHENVLRALVHVKEGEPLDPGRLQTGQFALTHLGVFSAVDLDYEPPTGPTRDAVFRLTEGIREDVNLLFGYGSYEQFRLGVDRHRYNLFGRGHQDTLEGVQSMKSARGSYSYTVPELFGSSVDATAKILGLRRHEPSFLRKEYGVTLSAAWPLPRLGVDANVGYSFKRLFSTDNSLATSAVDTSGTNAASISVGLVRDRRDNPLTPRHGYKVSLQVEGASRKLGGQVDYQRLLGGVSYHTTWGRSRWIHAGLTHGLVTSMGAPVGSEPPVNVRFFPGGENSIRGYREGRASPRAADGQFLGAKTTLLLNLEVEQALTSKFSLVAFSDSLGMAARMADYPFDTRLYSVGLGIRYRTLIGPVRLEYGHNLNPRPRDPSGTVLFSLGFPF